MTPQAEQHITIEDLVNRAQVYLPSQEMELLRKAYEISAKAHINHIRPNGDPYISHVLSVAQILASMRLDMATIIGGLFHGILKEPATGVTLEYIEKHFGSDIAHIVDGTTQIDKVQFNSNIEYQAENIRKMFLAMASDIRVLLVKLADRLNDMQILDFPPEKSIEFAEETMELYAPLAGRLGIDWLKRELEDRAFSVLHPEEYKDLISRVDSSLMDREKYVNDIKELLSKELLKHHITTFKVLGRPKHILSIYQKLQVQNIPLEKVYDKVAFRIILDNVQDCYQALGMIHSLWTPIDSRIKDYIAHPKPNRYQSLHTSVIGPSGDFMEIQIRTEEMDKIAKEGIAAHWAYKEGAKISQQDASTFKWLKQLVVWLQELKDPKEFLDTIKDELLPLKKTYVLTPNGEVKELVYGSTPLDFAYAIHTEVGNHCTGAKINGVISSLKKPLQNGDVIEIITSQNQIPNQGWLNLVRTGRAKSRIRHWLRQDEWEKACKVGEHICTKALKKHGLNLKKLIKSGKLRTLFQELHCNSLEELMYQVGSGKISTSRIIQMLLPEKFAQEEQDIPSDLITSSGSKNKSDDILTIDGIDGVLMKISKCCMPMPGDEVMGFITAGRGISVHKAKCANLLATDPERWVSVQWNDTGASHQAQVSIKASDQKGLLAEVCHVVSEADANIVNIDAHASTGNSMALLHLIVEVKGLDHLSVVLQRIRNIAAITEARRV
jgi:guanosine-3',5'-bis(diphosphate) 3'-pyrophosphohydrolase